MNENDTVTLTTILALKNGDVEAFRLIYQHFAPRLYGNLLRLVKSEEIARELLQDIFLKIWEKHELIDPEKSLRAYLFQIAENQAYDFYRKAARNKKLQVKLTMAAIDTYSHVEETLISKEYHSLIQKAIDALPPRRQQIFRLCKIDGKSYEEVSLQLGISTSTIGDHIVKATRFIQKYCYSS
jgi:RNA polymerase sigma-70 factor (ECF subfamily)